MRATPTVRALTLVSVLAVLGLAACGGSKNASTGAKGASTGATDAAAPAKPGDGAAVRAVLSDLRAAAAAGDANSICTRIFTHKLAVKVRSTDKAGSCTRVMRRGFKATRNLKVLSVKVTDAGSATARIKDGLGARGALVLVKQGGRWRIDELTSA